VNEWKRAVLQVQKESGHWRKQKRLTLLIEQEEKKKRRRRKREEGRRF